MSEFEPSDYPSMHLGEVKDNAGRPFPHLAYLTYGSPHGTNDGDCEIEITGTRAHECARLIAAAPKMLDLLRWMDRKGGLGYDVHDRIHAVIAEIEGVTLKSPAEQP